MDGPRELGLEPEGLQRIVQTLCEDLLMGHNGSGSLLGGVDDSAMASLMAEVDDAVLQRKVLRLAIAAAHTDKHLADGKPWFWPPLAFIGALVRANKQLV